MEQQDEWTVARRYFSLVYGENRKEGTTPTCIYNIIAEVIRGYGVEIAFTRLDGTLPIIEILEIRIMMYILFLMVKRKN
jgi:hypothetical protein